MWSNRHCVFYSIRQNPFFFLSSAWHSCLHLHVAHVLLKGYYLHSDLQSSLLHPWSCHSTPAHPGWGLCWCKWCRRRSASLRSAGVGRNSEVLQIDDSLERNRDELWCAYFCLSFDSDFMAFDNIQYCLRSCINWYFYINNGCMPFV